MFPGKNGERNKFKFDVMVLYVFLIENMVCVIFRRLIKKFLGVVYNNLGD